MSWRIHILSIVYTIRTFFINNAVRLVVCEGRELGLILFLIIKSKFFPPPMHLNIHISNVKNLKESCRYCVDAHSRFFFQSSRCYQGNQSNTKIQTCCSLGNHWTNSGIVAPMIFWYAILFLELVHKTQKFRIEFG